MLVRSKSFIAGAIIVGFWVLCAIFGKLLVPQDPFASNPLNELQAPSADYWFGTDRLGRDVFSRVIVGARDILIIAPAGDAARHGPRHRARPRHRLLPRRRRRRPEPPHRDASSRCRSSSSRCWRIASLGPSNLTIIVVVGFVFAPVIARTVRAAVLSERELEYVAAARLRNERTPYILFAEILPNVMGPVIVEFTVRLGYAIFIVATLSFLGFGVQPPSPDWGLQVFEHYGLISGGFWWPVLFPAAAIATLVIGVNLIADGLTQAFER